MALNFVQSILSFVQGLQGQDLMASQASSEAVLSATSSALPTAPWLDSALKSSPAYSALWKGQYKSYGERLLSRILKLHTADVLIENHDHLKSLDPDKPLAVVIYPTADYNQAYEADSFPLLDTLVDSDRFNVLYYEAKGPKDVEKILGHVTEQSGRKVHTLILGGHGSSQTLALGTDNCSKENDKCLLLDTFGSSEARFQPDLLTLDHYLEKNGQVVLDSCSNGQGGAEEPNNLANHVALTLPGRKVYAAEFSGNYKSFSVNEDLSLDIVWSGECEKSKMYVATAEEIEDVKKTKDLEKQWAAAERQLLGLIGREEVNPGTTLKGAYFSAFATSFGWRSVQKIQNKFVTFSTEDELAQRVRAEIDAFVKKNPDWSAGGVFEYVGWMQEWGTAKELHSLYTTGHAINSATLASKTFTVPLPHEKTAKAFVEWKKQPKLTSTGVPHGDSRR